MKTNKSISKKITTTILIVCFSALLITGIIIVKTVSTRFKDNKRQILNETALSISNKAEVFFEKYITVVEQMAHDKNLQDFMINAEGYQTLPVTRGFDIATATTDAIQKADSEIILTAYIAEGDYYLASPTVYTQSEYDVTSKEYYNAVTENKVCITDPYIDAITGGIVITISAPVNVDGEIVGLTAVDIAIDKLINMVDEYELGDTGYFTLLSKNNVIIAHKDKDNLLKKVDEINLSDNIVQSVINKDRSLVEFTYNNDWFI